MTGLLGNRPYHLAGLLAEQVGLGDQRGLAPRGSRLAATLALRPTSVGIGPFGLSNEAISHIPGRESFGLSGKRQCAWLDNTGASYVFDVFEIGQIPRRSDQIYILAARHSSADVIARYVGVTGRPVPERFADAGHPISLAIRLGANEVHVLEVQSHEQRAQIEARLIRKHGRTLLNKEHNPYENTFASLSGRR